MKMLDEVVEAEVSPEKEAPVVKDETAKEEKEDIVARVSKMKLDDVSVKEDESFDVSAFDEIEDEKAREIAMKVYKTYDRGYQKKFQDLAKMKKEYEQLANKNEEWTPERIEQLIKDEKFLEAAKSIVGTQEEDEYSSLTPAEKERLKKIDLMERELQKYKSDAENQKIMQTFRQQDEELKSRFANYEPEAVDSLMQDLVSNKVQATREHIWKVIDYENAVKRAYEAGKQDRKLEVKEKMESSSATGVSATQDTGIERKENESTADFIRRIGQQVLKRKQ